MTGFSAVAMVLAILGEMNSERGFWRTFGFIGLLSLFVLGLEGALDQFIVLMAVIGEGRMPTI